MLTLSRAPSDDSTFAVMTTEEVLDSGALPAAETLRERYLPA
jgi:hypothetical protein